MSAPAGPIAIRPVQIPALPPKGANAPRGARSSRSHAGRSEIGTRSYMTSRPPQGTDRERKLLNFRVGKVCRMAERFGYLFFQSCNFEPRHRGHKMCPRCVALGCCLGERGIDEKIEPWRVNCLGKDNIVAVCDQLIHHEALSCVSPQRPTGTWDSEFARSACKSNGIPEIIRSGKVCGHYNVVVDRSRMPDHLASRYAKGLCRVGEIS